MHREATVGRVGVVVGVARMVLLVTIALVITTLGMPQAITGVLVNALLILTVGYVGVKEATLVGMVTPLGAALRGVLPLPLWVMIPFIAMSNAVLVSVYDALRAKNEPLALAAAAVCKFALLYAVVTLLTAFPLSVGTANGAALVSLPGALAQMMRWPQLATALGGGLLAGVVRLGASKIAKR